MAQQLPQAQAPRQGSTGQQSTQALQQQQEQAAEDQRRHHATPQQGEGQYQIQAQAPHDQAQGEQCRAIDHPGAGRDGQHVATQYPQRRYAAQCGKRWQGEAGQGDQPGADPGNGRQQSTRRYVGRQQVVQKVEQTELRQPAQHCAGQAREQAQYAQLQAEEQHGFAPRQSQAAQQCTGVETSSGKTVGRQGHGHASQQHRHEAGHVQVALGFAQGAADLLVAVP